MRLQEDERIIHESKHNSKVLGIFVMLLCLGLVGCAILPGNISERVSGFDKTQEIYMEPAWAGNIGLGLYKTSKMDVDKAVLTAVVKDAHNFFSTESLQFNIDGEITTLESIDAITKIETHEGVHNSVVNISGWNQSSKRYEVTKDLIKRLIEGNEVWVKVNLSQEYIESKFSVDMPMGARASFKKFYGKVWGD